jgi:hypothetical protein
VCGGFQITARKYQCCLSGEKEPPLNCGINRRGFLTVKIAQRFLLMPNTASGHDLPGKSVDRPESHLAKSVPGAPKEDASGIKISRGGQVYFGDFCLSRDALADLILAGLRNSAERRVYLSAGAHAG